MDYKKIYQQMFTIRALEMRLLELFSEGKLNGTTHAYIGQEANAISVISQLTRDDVLWSNHRCHGHYIAYTDDVEGLIHELVGTPKGVCGGKGGSQHLCNGNFFTNGIQGSIVPVSVGMALSCKFSKQGITTVFIGDGTLGEGVLYESLNIASLWKLPLLVVIENNGYAQSTPSKLQISGTVADRPKAFGIKTFEVSSNDVAETIPVATEAVSFVRQEQEPATLIMNTYRLCPHSKGDDTRDQSEIDAWKLKDPLLCIEKRLDTEVVENIKRSVLQRIASAVAEALHGS